MPTIAPTQLDFDMYRGTDFAQTLTGSPIPLDNCQLSGFYKPQWNYPNTGYAFFSLNPSGVAHTGYIFLSGQETIMIPGSVGYYSIHAYSGTAVFPVFWGRVYNYSNLFWADSLSTL